MENKVEGILDTHSGKEFMAKQHLEAVNAIEEVLKAYVLSDKLEKKLLILTLRDGYEKKAEDLTASYAKMFHEFREEMYAIQLKLNTNSQKLGITQLQDSFRVRGNENKAEIDSADPSPADKHHGKPGHNDMNQG